MQCKDGRARLGGIDRRVKPESNQVAYSGHSPLDEKESLLSLWVEAN